MATITLATQTSPSTPSAGNIVFYGKSDGKLYCKNDAGTETQVSFPLATKGDLLQGVTGGTFSSLTIGANNAVLVADSTQTTGAKWTTTPSFLTTIGVGGATPAGTGSGISFPATQSASSDANTLDDYEEGTWTPSVGGSATYTTQHGHYTKIGERVLLDGQIQINAIGTGSTTVVSGLPFTASNATAVTKSGISAHFFAASATSITWLGGYILQNSTTATLQSLTAAGSGTGTNAFFQNSAQVVFTGSYFT